MQATIWDEHSEIAEDLAIADARAAHEDAFEHLTEILDLARIHPDSKMNIFVAIARTAVCDARRNYRAVTQHFA